MKFTIFLLSFYLCLQSVAGTRDSGGDPQAEMFLSMAKKLSAYFSQNPFNEKLPFLASDFSSAVLKINESIVDETVADLLEFTDKILTDKDGIEKGATFNQDTGKIFVSRKIWNQYQEEERLILITMEISGILKAENRYERAQALIHNRVALILSFAAIDDGSAPQESDFFSRITDEDVLIDGGVLGQGDERNAKIISFLTQPAAHQVWIDRIQRAWNHGRPAFILLRNKENSAATMSAIVPLKKRQRASARAHVKLITLGFDEINAMEQGFCNQSESEVLPFERIQNCLLNLKLFTSSVIREKSGALSESLGDLKTSLEKFYAGNILTIKMAMEKYFILNYSAAIIGGDEQVSDSAVRANGLEPSLMGPFAVTDFWVPTNKKNLTALKLFTATRFLFENGLVYLSGSLKCGSHPKEKPLTESPKIMKIAEYRAISSTCDYSTATGTFPAEDLYKTMEHSGFQFKNDSWIQN